MSATAAARERVTDTGTNRAPAFRFGVAGPADDPEIRRLLRETSLPGDVALSLEREPDASLAGSIEGDVHQVVLARRSESGELAGMAARSVYTAFVNGRPARVAYLSQLRVTGHPRHLRSLIDGGFTACRALGTDASVQFASLVDGNAAAERLLVKRRSPSMPRLVPLDRFVTFLVGVRRRRSVASPSSIRAGSAALLPEIVACLQRNLRRYQLAPVWDTTTLLSDRSRGLGPEDFVVAVDDERVVGCAALWDQRSFKQVVVRGYSRRIRRVRPLLNLLAPAVGYPRLPAVGQPFEFASLSHVAVDNDDPAVLDALVAAQAVRARRRGIDQVVIGCSERHPCSRMLASRWAHRLYRSTLYAAQWDDPGPTAGPLDGRPVQPEVAML